MAELRIENVFYKYGKTGVQVLKGISACFDGGKLHAVTGPSGSGKTTLLSLMMGLDVPASGEIFADGEELSKLDMDLYRRNKVAMIFQSFQLFPLLTAEENVCYPLELKGVSKKEALKEAERLLGLVEITKEKLKRFPSQLSGGEQQRVAIARAIATGAEIILADEPTGNLDKENTLSIFKLFSKLAKEQGYCVVVVTHDLELAGMSDNVFKLDDGVLKEEVGL